MLQLGRPTGHRGLRALATRPDAAAAEAWSLAAAAATARTRLEAVCLAAASWLFSAALAPASTLLPVLHQVHVLNHLSFLQHRLLLAARHHLTRCSTSTRRRRLPAAILEVQQELLQKLSRLRAQSQAFVDHLQRLGPVALLLLEGSPSLVEPRVAVMQGKGALSIVEVARIVGPDLAEQSHVLDAEFPVTRVLRRANSRLASIRCHLVDL